MKLCVVCGALVRSPVDFVSEPPTHERERRGQARWYHNRLVLCVKCSDAKEADVVDFVYAKMKISQHNSGMSIFSENRFTGEGET